MRRFALFALPFVILAGPSTGVAQGIVIQERPVPLEIISQNVRMGGSAPLVPLEDIAKALGSRLEFDSMSGRYSVQPSGNGVLALLERPSPTGDGRTPPVDTSFSFSVADQLVSKGIIIVGGKPHMPLADLASAMNSTLERSNRGAWTLVPRPGAGSGLLGLSEKGIIIIGARPRR